MKPNSQRRRRGYTLIELSVVMVVGLAVAALCLTMLSQYLTFQQMMSRQAFLIEEAPVLNNLLSRMVGRAEGIRLYPDLASALGESGAVDSGASALALSYSNPDNTRSFAVIGLEETSTGKFLRFYPINPGGGVNSAASAAWTLSRSVSAVDFRIEQGILRITLTGPNEESITYSGTQQL
jgi:prepilin-type N-terminal cleavage/methylation domain-containing protein